MKFFAAGDHDLPFHSQITEVAEGPRCETGDGIYSFWAVSQRPARPIFADCFGFMTFDPFGIILQSPPSQTCTVSRKTSNEYLISEGSGRSILRQRIPPSPKNRTHSDKVVAVLIPKGSNVIEYFFTHVVGRAGDRRHFQFPRPAIATFRLILRLQRWRKVPL